jgi:hypothetical protein
MSRYYKMPKKYNSMRKYHGKCEECGERTPFDKIHSWVDGSNISITYYSPYLCKSCYDMAHN